MYCKYSCKDQTQEMGHHIQVILVFCFIIKVKYVVFIFILNYNSILSSSGFMGNFDSYNLNFEYYS